MNLSFKNMLQGQLGWLSFILQKIELVYFWHILDSYFSLEQYCFNNQFEQGPWSKSVVDISWVHMLWLATFWKTSDRWNSQNQYSMHSESIQKIYLQNNKLISLPEGIFTSNYQQGLTQIALAGNQWYCNCTIFWLAKWVAKFFLVAWTRF